MRMTTMSSVLRAKFIGSSSARFSRPCLRQELDAHVAQQLLQHVVLRMAFAEVLDETFRVPPALPPTVLGRHYPHEVQILIAVHDGAQPFPLRSVTGKHPRLGFQDGGNV